MEKTAISKFLTKGYTPSLSQTLIVAWKVMSPGVAVPFELEVGRDVDRIGQVSPVAVRSVNGVGENKFVFHLDPISMTL
jgi:hypothetical protein